MGSDIQRQIPRAERFDTRARELVLEALERVAPPRTHVSGSTVVKKVCALAQERFGIAARLVLEYWGIRSTRDIGLLVFDMVEEGVIGVSPEDSIDDFSEVVDLHEALEVDYPWGG
ncbi:hypothetical protein JXA88_15235 [Candidatus Fermentibacteria bacterium]|nr:hypothetical protein [Candidatus Fermentibacteria bacterium]